MAINKFNQYFSENGHSYRSFREGVAKVLIDRLSQKMS